MVVRYRPKEKKPAPCNRLEHFESREAMERHDAEIAALMESYEEKRHQAEVTTLCGMAAAAGEWEPITRYLAIVRKKRGDAGADRLARDIKAQWKAGNRGERGSWRNV